MLRLRHVLHPINTARIATRMMTRQLYRLSVAPRFREFPRGARDLCWCGGYLRELKWRRSFGVCERCGSYVNRRPPMEDELRNLYSLDLYWRIRQRMRDHPPIEERAELYREDGRLEKWMNLVEKYGPTGGTAIEVGCAPGVLLQELTPRGFHCIGVEISEDVAAWLRQNLGLDIRAGFFPGVDLPPCSLFLAFDVLEHSPCPEEFLKEVSHVLSPGGVAIIQTAIDRYDFAPPFGERCDMFDDLEHFFLFTDKAMSLLAERAGLEIVSLSERVWLAGEVCVFRKPEKPG